jgi:hypothetical protein
MYSYCFHFRSIEHSVDYGPNGRSQEEAYEKCEGLSADTLKANIQRDKLTERTETSYKKVLISKTSSALFRKEE